MLYSNHRKCHAVLVGYRHYQETYEKSDNRWYIKASKLTRLPEDIVTPLFSVYMSPRVRNRAAKFAHRMIEK